MKLNVKAFALSCGIVWGVGVLCLAWWIILFDGPTGEITMLGRVYRGFSITPVGSLVGFVWGLCDGFIGGAIFALIYNKLAGSTAASESN